MSLSFRRWSRRAFLTMTLCFTVNALAAEPAPPLTVFAAASLKESMDEATATYEKSSGQAVRVSYGGSSALARQIEQGAPADVFISADLDWMDTLQKQGLVDVATRHDLLGNTLVLIAPSTSQAKAPVLKSGTNLLPCSATAASPWR